MTKLSKRQKEERLVQLTACRLKGHKLVDNKLLILLAGGGGVLPAEANEKHCLTCHFDNLRLR